MLSKILVANRGEIAIRVMRACRELGISSVAVYSEADKDALHVQMADEAVAIGPASARQSYLSIPAIVEAASRVHADAVHPGYGFLAENPALAEVLAVWGITFIGPKAESIRAMGLKTTAKETMRRAGVPLAPGSVGAISELQEAQREAERIGYPVMVKAVAGGGGRGIRVARQAADLPDALERAASEAKSSFGDGAVFLEKYVEDPRHIEVQVMADGQGGYLALGERECSLQRRRQKLVEEAPSVAITPTQRQAVSEAAIRAAEAVDYIGAGTVEFLLDPQTGEFYFMEMNTRIQVEHGVTELVTGEDLVKSQIQVASGEALGRTGWETQMVGWAMECRINAEDPDQDFRPSPGTISRFQPPGFAGVRVDAGVTAGSAITPYYDSLVAKLMTWGRDRTEAISRMRSALSEFRVEGIATTIPIHQKIMADPDFIKGAIHTNFLERRFPGA
ncbi:MAG: acetyl-CoA carboxylase biotin carboxylase subunit [Sulfobacillus sp.]